MKGYLGFGRCTEICATGEWNGSFSALATAGAVGQLLRTLVLLALLTWSAAPARAGRPLAENLVFGSVSKAGRGELSTNLVIEARRGDVGPVVARCRIGEDPGAGDLFFLRIQRESAPALSPVAVDAEDVLTLVFFLLMAALTGNLAARQRSQLQALRETQAQTNQLLDLSR